MSMLYWAEIAMPQFSCLDYSFNGSSNAYWVWLLRTKENESKMLFLVILNYYCLWYFGYELHS